MSTKMGSVEKGTRNEKRTELEVFIYKGHVLLLFLFLVTSCYSQSKDVLIFLINLLFLFEIQNIILFPTKLIT